MKELPQGWEKVQLGELIELKYGKALPETVRDGRGFPVFGSNGIVGSHSEPLTNGETLIVGRKGSVGEVQYSVAPCSPIDTTYYVDCLWGMPFRFWLYYLRHLNLQDLNKATAVPGLSRKDAYGHPIHLAPLNEQKRIADKLDALLAQVDACCERLDRVPQTLKRFRQAVLTAATSGTLSDEWRKSEGDEAEWIEVELDDVAEEFSYGSSSKSSREGKIPVLRMGNIQNGRLDWDNLVFTSDTKEIEKYRLHAGDVLFNRTNSPELVGKTAVFKGEREAIYAGYLIRVRCGNKLLPDFLNYCLNSPSGRDYCWQVKSDGVSQSNINAKKLAAFPINLPPHNEQLEIVRRVETLFAFADRLETRYIASRERIDQLIPSLFDKAFSGDLTAEWREQNPDLISGENSAEALLARIKAEKTEAVRAITNNRKSVKTKIGKNMHPKMIIPVAVALKAAGTPLAAQELLKQSGYSSDATTEDLERFFLDIRDQLKLGSILRERSGDNDIFTLVN